MQFVIQVNLQFSGQFQFVLGKASVSAAVILKFSNTVILLPWSSLLDEGSYLSNLRTNWVIFLRELSRLFWYNLIKIVNFLLINKCISKVNPKFSSIHNLGQSSIQFNLGPTLCTRKASVSAVLQ